MVTIPRKKCPRQHHTEKTRSTGLIPAPNCHNCNTSELESDQLFWAGQMPKTCVSSKPGDRGDGCAQGVNVAPLVTLWQSQITGGRAWTHRMCIPSPLSHCPHSWCLFKPSSWYVKRLAAPPHPREMKNSSSATKRFPMSREEAHLSVGFHRN